jgi:hypothetical protein
MRVRVTELRARPCVRPCVRACGRARVPRHILRGTLARIYVCNNGTRVCVWLFWRISRRRARVLILAISLNPPTLLAL